MYGANLVLFLRQKKRSLTFYPAMHYIHSREECVFVEQSSTKEHYHHPPPEFGNDCQPLAGARASAFHIPFIQFFFKQFYKCLIFTILEVSKFFILKALLSHRAKACFCPYVMLSTGGLCSYI
jgi:hypothetical protein